MNDHKKRSKQAEKRVSLKASMKQRKKNNRILSVAAFSCLFAYLLSFVFEGKVLYGLLELYKINSACIFLPIVMHFAGLFFCGSFVKSFYMAKRFVLMSSAICLLFTVPFFFAPSFVLWLVSLIILGFCMGTAVSSWGYFLKEFTPQTDRIKSCADMLIFSNIVMVVINIVTLKTSAILGLVLAVCFLIIGVFAILLLPSGELATTEDHSEKKLQGDLKKTLTVLFLFVSVVTVNSGLMYQIINPAFDHLTSLVSWYWAVPYIAALMVMRNFPVIQKRSIILYVAILMVMGAFICFMIMGRNATDYFVIDTLILGACGIFDLFWWSIIAEMLNLSQNPAKVFGIGLSANVFGVFCGDILGFGLTSVALPGAQVTVIALCVICATLAIIPLLNRHLAELLKNHTNLNMLSDMNSQQQKQGTVAQNTETHNHLTERENDVLSLILSGKPNKEIAATLFISENTVKTHARNIYLKYGVASRAELISTLLKKDKSV